MTQIILRIPLLKVLTNIKWYQKFQNNALFYSLFLGLTAGLFEEIGRYLGMNLFLQNQLAWKTGIAFGLGHGAIESILLVGITYINNLIYSIKINQGIFDEEIAPKFTAETAKNIKKKLVDTPAADFVLGGIERVFTLIIQVALSLLVLYAVMNGQVIFLFYALLVHVLVDFLPAYLRLTECPLWMAEFFLLIVSSICLWYMMNFIPF